jgi:hypothetical protein
VTAYPGGTTSLVDILDRVLDKGLVVAGDIKVSLANVELLTIKIRLLVCSIDKAEQIGLNWWRYDDSLVRQPEPAGALPEGAVPASLVARLEERIAELERQLETQERQGGARRRGREPRLSEGSRGGARPGNGTRPRATQRRTTE